MSKANDLIPKGYFDTHKVVDGTAAGVLVDMAVSDLILFPEEKMPDLELSPEEAALAEEVRTCTDAEQLVRWMRKPVSGLLRSRILRRALAFEKDVLPLMEHRALTTQLDAFEDCVTMFFASVNTIFAWSFFDATQSTSAPPSWSPMSMYSPRPEQSTDFPFFRPMIHRTSLNCRMPSLSTKP